MKSLFKRPALTLGLGSIGMCIALINSQSALANSEVNLPVIPVEPFEMAVLGDRLCVL